MQKKNNLHIRAFVLCQFHGHIPLVSVYSFFELYNVSTEVTVQYVFLKKDNYLRCEAAYYLHMSDDDKSKYC